MGVARVIATLDQLRQGPTLHLPWLRDDLVEARLCRSLIAGGAGLPWRADGLAAAPSREVASPDAAAEAAIAAVCAACESVLPSPFFGQAYQGLPREPMMMLRYGPGDHFGLHTDGARRPAPGVRSLFAVLVYLNDDFVGGGTVFPDLGLTVPARTGAALFVPHGLRHFAEPVTDGRKHAFHAYAMYETAPTPPPLTTRR
jgi:predicted 2-oxoglutarate/Fe(II)-dependent dioxygenase YbiX